MTIVRPIQARFAVRSFGGALPGLLVSAALCLLGAGVAMAQDPGNSLQDVQVQALPGNRIELRLIMAEPAAAPVPRQSSHVSSRGLWSVASVPVAASSRGISRS